MYKWLIGGIVSLTLPAMAGTYYALGYSSCSSLLFHYLLWLRRKLHSDILKSKKNTLLT
jgi:hypothetical protein